MTLDDRRPSRHGSESHSGHLPVGESIDDMRTFTGHPGHASTQAVETTRGGLIGVLRGKEFACGNLRHACTGKSSEQEGGSSESCWAWIVGASILLKLLLVPTYRSTDFEVHRNWLAITGTQPLSTWYKPDSSPSKWTLDYPPLFAFFEFFLSLFARLVDPEMLKVENENYASAACIWFQRLTVIFTDFVLVIGVRSVCRAFRHLRTSTEQPAEPDQGRQSDLSNWQQRAEANKVRSEVPAYTQTKEQLHKESQEECGHYEELTQDNKGEIEGGGIQQLQIGLEKGHKKRIDEDDESWSDDVALALTLFNAGLLIVDHIHFQYNGFLLGILLLSIAQIQEGHYCRGSVSFACLLLLKHIFLYVAPVYFVFLLSRLRKDATAFVRLQQETGKARKHARVCSTNQIVGASPLGSFSVQEKCHPTPTTSAELSPPGGMQCSAAWEDAFSSTSHLSTKVLLVWLAQVIKIGGLVGFVAVAIVLPFAVTGQLSAMLCRLFPFGRGLLHAQWAANFWAVYEALDRLLRLAGRKLRLLPASEQAGALSSTKGLVTVTSHVVLPDVAPLTVALLTLALYTPLLIVIWRRPSSRLFPVYVALGASVCFATGWHVHEKAVLLVTIPLGVAAWASSDPFLRTMHFVLNTASNVAILPLLPRPHESLLKLTLLLFSTILETMCLFAGTERIGVWSVKRDDTSRVEKPVLRKDCSTSCTSMQSYPLVETAPLQKTSTGTSPERFPSRKSYLRMRTSRSANTARQAGLSEPISLRHHSFLTCLTDRCVQVLSWIAPRVYVRLAFKVGGVISLVMLFSVSILYALQSDFVPNLVLLKLYGAEHARAIQAARISVFHGAAGPGQDKDFASSNPAPLYGDLKSNGGAIDGHVSSETWRMHILEKLAVLLAWHSSSSEWKRSAVHRQLTALLLSDRADNNRAVSSRAFSSALENEMASRYIYTEGEVQAGQAKGTVELNCSHGISDQCVLESSSSHWRDDIPWSLRVLYRWHAIARHFEFLPLLLLVCGCALWNIAAFVALHAYVCAFCMRTRKPVAGRECACGGTQRFVYLWQ
ncbi:alg8 glycosyltransferase family protein [Cystoisospora suis]|uniref:dolichyl-P-Glc:Glc1Man9GlcNAc2-PP-dolichol alpha-1,3-glucosyltransferase n=1 Tax=Cystoisospora suis TaxID=483139 RepID=A0A2C6LES2_9APIC|nr:alg8 glycosyltransferase family protein [Cystoisospora suis]